MGSLISLRSAHLAAFLRYLKASSRNHSPSHQRSWMCSVLLTAISVKMFLFRFGLRVLLGDGKFFDFFKIVLGVSWKPPNTTYKKGMWRELVSAGGSFARDVTSSSFQELGFACAHTSLVLA